MRRIRSGGPGWWWLALGVAGTAAIGAIQLLGTVAVREAFWSVVAATAVGIVLGVPVALFLARRQQQQEEAREAGDQERARRDDERGLLQVILQDLADIELELERRRPGLHDRQLLVPFLGSNLWDAIAGHRLDAVQRPVTLRAVARAYHRISVTRFLEQEWFAVAHHLLAGSMSFPPGQHPADDYRRYTAEQDRHTAAAIDHAQQLIGEDLVRLRKIG